MTFDAIFDRIIDVEGGYVDDPHDPGGETQWGISKGAYPHVDVKNLTREGAKAIYFRDVWQRLKADTLQPGVAYQLMDFAVHSGPETAVRYLQRAVGVADDGHWGPVSQAAEAGASRSWTLMRFAAERLDFLTRLSGWPAFGKGWARRIAQNLRYGSEDIDVR